MRVKFFSGIREREKEIESLVRGVREGENEWHLERIFVEVNVHRNREEFVEETFGYKITIYVMERERILLVRIETSFTSIL